MGESCSLVFHLRWKPMFGPERVAGAAWAQATSAGARTSRLAAGMLYY